jgi:hypothetical protein
MPKIFLVLASSSALFYSAMAVIDWRGCRTECATENPRAYFWGLLFALLFYFGFPLWWWRYGLRKSIWLMLGCMAPVMAVPAVLRLIGLISDSDTSLAVGLLISVPVRGAGGMWVARRDAAWRGAKIVKVGKSVVD